MLRADTRWSAIAAVRGSSIGVYRPPGWRFRLRWLVSLALPPVSEAGTVGIRSLD